VAARVCSPKRPVSSPGFRRGNSRVSEEARLSDAIAEAASAVAGTLVQMLAYAITREAEAPSPAELLTRLKDVENAAQLLLRAIADPLLRALLVDRDEWLENENEGAALLRDIAAKATEAQMRNPPNKGPGHPKSVLPIFIGPHARELCALMTGLIWRVIHRRWPGQKNPEAHRLCEGLWLAAGGAPHGGLAARDGALTAWRLHLRAAKQYQPPHPAGERLARIMAPPAPKRESGLRRSLALRSMSCRARPSAGRRPKTEEAAEKFRLTVSSKAAQRSFCVTSS